MDGSTISMDGQNTMQKSRRRNRRRRSRERRKKRRRQGPENKKTEQEKKEAEQERRKTRRRRARRKDGLPSASSSRMGSAPKNAPRQKGRTVWKGSEQGWPEQQPEVYKVGRKELSYGSKKLAAGGSGSNIHRPSKMKTKNKQEEACKLPKPAALIYVAKTAAMKKHCSRKLHASAHRSGSSSPGKASSRTNEGKQETRGSLEVPKK